MDDINILRIVASERRYGLGGVPRGYKQSSLLEDLGLSAGSTGALRDFGGLSEGALSKILSGQSDDGADRLRQALKRQDHELRPMRDVIAKEINLPEIFKCTSRDAVLAAISQKDAPSPEIPSVEEVEIPSRFDRFENLTPIEADAAMRLAESIATSSDSGLHWRAPVEFGVSYIVRSCKVYFDKLRQFDVSPYEKMIIIRPSNVYEPFDAEISHLSNLFHKVTGDIYSRLDLARAIIKNRILLVVLSPVALDHQTPPKSALVELLRAFRFIDESRGKRYGANIVCIGQSQKIAKIVPNWEFRPGTHQVYMNVKPEDRVFIFREQWIRFAGQSYASQQEEAGSRTRRADHFFKSKQAETIVPINIKLWALFSANEINTAYFDPTQGFCRLAGCNYNIYPDIVSFYRDIYDFIKIIAGSSKINGVQTVRALRYISTAKHWLTETALDALLKRYGNYQKTDMQFKSFQKFLANIPFVSPKPASNNRRVYFCEIAIKAIIQDHWIAEDPFFRSLSHYRIASRLKGLENNKDELAREFPYEPHWGRSRIFFIAETIRHLVRASSTYAKDIKKGSLEECCAQFPQFNDDTDSGGLDPYIIINYCYNVLYQRDLNGVSGNSASRTLAKRNGAYQLALELLELLSQDNKIGVPHPALDHSLRFEFIKECGYILLDVGRLKEAIECFFRAQSEARSRQDVNKIDEIDTILDIVLVKSTMGLVDDAENLIQEAEKNILKIIDEYSLNDGTSREQIDIQNLYRRMLSRRAHNLFLKGGSYNVLKIIDTLEQGDPRSGVDGVLDRQEGPMRVKSRRLDSEQAHVKIAALSRLSSVNPSTVDSRRAGRQALGVCIDYLFRSESDGLRHQAMGFRIALCRRTRNLRHYEAAEKILDEVYRDILQFGCSERTFLAFLNEAGKFLLETGQPIRAYATYLRPCLVRSVNRSFYRQAEQAFRLSASALAIIGQGLGQAVVFAPETSGVPESTENALQRHRALLDQYSDIFEGNPMERDPLFAYSIADAEKIILKLAKLQGVRDEWNFVRDHGQHMGISFSGEFIG